MTAQAEIVLAFVFKRSGKTELSFSEIYLTLSMELNWFNPEDAKKFVNKSLSEKLLTKKNSQIRPCFDISKIDIPLGFFPKGALFEEKVKTEEKKISKLNQIIKKIEGASNKDRKVIYEKIKKIERERNLTTIVSALLLAKEYGLFLGELIPDIERKMV